MNEESLNWFPLYISSIIWYCRHFGDGVDGADGGNYRVRYNDFDNLSMYRQPSYHQEEPYK